MSATGTDLHTQIEAAIHDAESLASRLSGMRPTAMENGTNGTSKAIQVVGAIELHDMVASYRTALVALVAMIKRDGGYRGTADQMLIRQIERMLDKDKTPR